MSSIPSLQSVAQELKTKLEEARKLKESHPATTFTGAEREPESEEVVLTRTGRGGVVLPLPERTQDPQQRGRKHRKKEKVSDTDCWLSSRWWMGQIAYPEIQTVVSLVLWCLDEIEETAGQNQSNLIVLFGFAYLKILTVVALCL